VVCCFSQVIVFDIFDAFIVKNREKKTDENGGFCFRRFHGDRPRELGDRVAKEIKKHHG